MKKFLAKILFISLFFIPTISHAEISQAVFITDAQSIKTNSASGKITIQTQDSSGGAEAIGETSDVFVECSSPTGEFSSNADNWQSVSEMTMNSNWSNRSFYYKDSSEGSFTITVKIKRRTSEDEWTASQNITVSDSSSDSPDSSRASSNSESSSDTSSSSSSNSSLTKVSTPGRKLEITAGEDRIFAPGSPIWFQATVKKNTTLSEVKFHWSFGDGEVGIGNMVSHTYKYPGNYAVVLSANVGDLISTSRLKVKIINPSLSVSEGGSFVEITNNTDSEINLFKWRLESDSKGFIFQPNMIILPKSSIKIDKNLFTLKGSDNAQGISLENSVGEEIFAVSEIRSDEISLKVNELQKEAYSLVDKAVSQKLVFESAPKTANAKSDSESQNIGTDNQETEKGSELNSTENIIYKAPKEKGFFGKISEFFSGLFD